MKMHRLIKIVILFHFLLLFVPIYTYGLNLKITNAETGLLCHTEYNVSMHFSWDIAAIGMLELNDLLNFKCGVAVGQSWDIAAVDAYGSIEFHFPFPGYIPLRIRTAYIYNGFPSYQIHTHTLIPLASLTWRYFGVSAGYKLRFTTSSTGPVLFEPIMAFSVFAYFLNTKSHIVGIGLANYDDFAGNNFSSYFFMLNNRSMLTEKIAISNELKVDISGNVGHLTSVYGISYRVGIIFKW